MPDPAQDTLHRLQSENAMLKRHTSRIQAEVERLRPPSGGKVLLLSPHDLDVMQFMDDANLGAYLRQRISALA